MLMKKTISVERWRREEERGFQCFSPLSVFNVTGRSVLCCAVLCCNTKSATRSNYMPCLFRRYEWSLTCNLGPGLGPGLGPMQACVYKAAWCVCYTCKYSRVRFQSSFTELAISHVIKCVCICVCVIILTVIWPASGPYATP